MHLALLPFLGLPALAIHWQAVATSLPGSDSTTSIKTIAANGLRQTRDHQGTDRFVAHNLREPNCRNEKYDKCSMYGLTLSRPSSLNRNDINSEGNTELINMIAEWIDYCNGNGAYKDHFKYLISHGMKHEDLKKILSPFKNSSNVAERIKKITNTTCSLLPLEERIPFCKDLITKDIALTKEILLLDPSATEILEALDSSRVIYWDLKQGDVPVDRDDSLDFEYVTLICDSCSDSLPDEEKYSALHEAFYNFTNHLRASAALLHFMAENTDKYFDTYYNLWLQNGDYKVTKKGIYLFFTDSIETDS